MGGDGLSGGEKKDGLEEHLDGCWSVWIELEYSWEEGGPGVGRQASVLYSVCTDGLAADGGRQVRLAFSNLSLCDFIFELVQASLPT